MTTMTSQITTRGLGGGACPNCGFVIAVTRDDTTTPRRCPECRTAIALTWVIGEFSEGVPCNGECQYATGPRCSCSCGGENHRRGYIHVEYVPAWVRKRDADRHQAKKDRAEARRVKARQSAAERAAEQRADNPELDTLMGDDYEGSGGFISDMRFALRNGKTLTPGQLDAVVAMVRRDREAAARRAAAQADRDTAAAAAIAAGVHCPTGRVTFTGEIVSTRQERDYMGRWTLLKVLVVTEAGWKAWGTLPGALARPTGGYNAIELEAHQKGLRGRRIELTANLTPKGDDPLFGIMKNPRGKLLD